MRLTTRVSLAIVLLAAVSCEGGDAPRQDTGTVVSPPETVFTTDTTAGPRSLSRHEVTKILAFYVTPAVSQTDVKYGSLTPGFDFEIVKVESYALTKVGVVTYNVKINTTSALRTPPGAFTAATNVNALLATALSARNGSATKTINLHYTSDGTGALTGGFVFVHIRPRL